MKDISLVIIIMWIMIAVISVITEVKTNEDYIKQLEQNEIEQSEEREVYVNKCKKYEDLLKGNGLLDECECR